MLKVQELFRTKPKDEALATLVEIGLDYREEKNNGVLYAHIDYNMGTDRTSTLAKECRGLGLVVGSWDIFRYGFNRFMNWDEEGRDPINLDKEMIYQKKIDGSLIFLHHFDGEWVVGTRGRLFPDAKVSDFSMTFPELFWKAFDECGGNRAALHPHFCYLFELCAPENRVVILYPQRHTVLLGARRLPDWKEIDVCCVKNLAERLQVIVPEVHNFASLEDCLKKAKTLPGTKEEGFVVLQPDGNDGYFRAKIKGADYLELHRIVSARSLNNLVKLVLQHKRDLLNDFPDYFPAYDTIQELFAQWIHRAGTFFLAERPLLRQSKKDFALSVKDTEFASCCFALASNKYSNVYEWFYQERHQTRPAIKRTIKQFKLQDVVGSSWIVVEDETEDI